MTPPIWALSLSYVLHLLTTVVWVGSLVAMQVLLMPFFSRLLDRQARFFSALLLQQRLEAPLWFSVLVLVATGLLQMSAHPSYQGFLAINSLWSWAILLKHLLIGVMVVLFAYQSWVVLPPVRRHMYQTGIALKALRNPASPMPHAALPEAWFSQVTRWQRLMRVHAFLGALVLLMTAIARAAS